MGNPWITALAALFLWWIATGTILVVVRLCERWGAERRAVVLALPVLGLDRVERLTGAITGPSRCPYPPRARKR